jgi:hypothetical protein
MYSYMRTLYIFLLSLFCQVSFSQTSFFVKGKVMDDSTGTSMEGASVICQNTTRGTFSDRDGAFGLQLPMGGHNLVITFAGYEPSSVIVTSATDKQDELIVRLKKKTKNLEEVVVMASNEVANGWEKHGKEFSSFFLGATPNAERCTITNPEAIKFYFSKKKNRLKVKAEDPITIINQALGYKIQYQLDSFIYEYNTKRSSYQGAAFYIEMDSTDTQKNIWKKNREKAYYGSRMHFMRCYYDSTLAENNYVIKGIEQDSITGKTKTETLDNPYDSTYYGLINGSEKEVLLVGKYLIEYTGEPMDRAYLQANKYPLSAKEQLSTVDLLDGFVITENGFFYLQKDVVNSGYWAWKNMADQLPYDYWPEVAENEGTVK